MVKPIINLVNQKFASLTVIEFSHRRPPHTYWKCLCDCGRYTTASTNNLKRGRHSSCGCGHGLSRTIERECWYNMKLRCGLCKQPVAKGYEGISIYGPWIDSFEKFLEDVGKCPKDCYSIDRKDPWGNYEPGNVRWASYSQQARNKRNHVEIVLPNGRTLKTWEFAKILGTTRKRAHAIAQRRGYVKLQK